MNNEEYDKLSNDEKALIIRKRLQERGYKDYNIDSAIDHLIYNRW